MPRERMDAEMPIFELLQAIAVKGGVLLIATIATALILRRQSAAIRHLVWTAGLAATLIVPLGSAVLPSWNLALPTAMQLSNSRAERLSPENWQSPSPSPRPANLPSTPTANRTGQPVIVNDVDHPVNDPAPLIGGTAAATTTERGSSWPAVAIIVWALGAAAVMAWV